MKITASLVFFSGRTCTVGGWRDIFLLHFTFIQISWMYFLVLTVVLKATALLKLQERGQKVTPLKAERNIFVWSVGRRSGHMLVHVWRKWVRKERPPCVWWKCEAAERNSPAGHEPATVELCRSMLDITENQQCVCVCRGGVMSLFYSDHTLADNTRWWANRRRGEDHSIIGPSLRCFLSV